MDPASEVSANADVIRGQIIPGSSPTQITPPKNIIQTPTAARTLYYRFRAEGLKRVQLYAQIEGLIAGNPPYNPVDLQKHGLTYIANFNPLDARSLYERSALAYWNLVNQAQFLAQFDVRNIPEPEMALEFSTILARNWTKVIKKWPAFSTQFNTLSAQIIKFGISPVMWHDERSWKWRTVELSRFYVADQALSDIEQLTCVCVETSFTAQYLFEIYEEYKDKPKDASPWNLDELCSLLLYRANSNVKMDREVVNMMDLQSRLQNGDLDYGVLFNDNIRIVSLLYQEYDGKISHYMFDRYFDKGKFLYFVDRQYQTLNEAFVLFTASPGEFTIHSNKGVGHKIFSGCQALMQLDCDIVNASRWASTPMLKSIATGSKDFEAIRFMPGVPTNIGTAEFVQNTFGANIDQLIGASQYISGKMQYNAGNSGDDPSIPDKSQGSISPSQARSQDFKEFGVLKHNIAHFYSQLDIVFRNMVAKMWHSKKGYPDNDIAEDWKRMCIEDGIPKEFFNIKNNDEDSYKLPRHIEVAATRVAGDGSTLATLMGLQELAPDVNAFGPKGQKQYLKQKITAVFGPEHVDAFVSPEEPDEMAGGASLAGVENAIMRQGESPIFSPDNEQRSHFVTHLALGNDTIRRIQQQQSDPVAADKIFTVLIPHMEEHWQTIVSNPYLQSFAGSVKQPWMQLSEYAKLNRKNAASMIQAQIKKQQEDQEKTQQVMSDEQRKDFQAQKAEARNDFKVQAQVARADEANVTRAEVQKDKVIRDSDNQRLKIRLDSNNKKIEDESLPELREQLDNINGRTIAPTDIEPPLNA